LTVAGVFFFLFGLFGLIYGLSYGLSGALSSGLSLGLSYWLLLGLYQGMVQEHIEDQDRHQFNQGIRRSLRNGMLLSLVSASIIAGMGVLSYVLSYGLNYELRFGLYGLRFGLSRGLSYGLSYVWILVISGVVLMWALSGGLTVLRHYVIRWLLARSRRFPWRAQAFLDDATARILLQRVGGGYRFMHRRLLDFFADLEARPVAVVIKHGQKAVLSTHVPSFKQPMPTTLDTLANIPTSPLSPVSLDDTRLLPCGHEGPPNARFCGVCGAPVPS